MATTKKAKALPTNNFTVSVNTGDTIATGTGATMLDAIKALEMPTKIVRKSIVSLSNGEKSTEFVYTIPRAKRIFYPITRHITAKHFSLLLK